MKARDFFLQPGDIFRFTDASNANLIYQVIEVRITSSTHSFFDAFVIAKPVFGIFKQDYKTNKRFQCNQNSGNIEKLDLLKLCFARQRLDEFIQEFVEQQTKDDVGSKG